MYWVTDIYLSSHHGRGTYQTSRPFISSTHPFHSWWYMAFSLEISHLRLSKQFYKPLIVFPKAYLQIGIGSLNSIRVLQALTEHKIGCYQVFRTWGCSDIHGIHCLYLKDSEFTDILGCVLVTDPQPSVSLWRLLEVSQDSKSKINRTKPNKNSFEL